MDTYPTLDLPVQVMDGDGDAVVSNISIKLTPGTEPTDVRLPDLSGHDSTMNVQMEGAGETVAFASTAFSMTSAPLDMANAPQQAGQEAKGPHLVMVAGEDTLVSGERVNFDLHLRTAQGDALAAQMAIMATFKVSNDAGDFAVPEELLGKPQQDAYGNAVTWTQDADGNYILTVILAPDNSSMHIEFDAFTHTKDGFVDPNQTLSMSLLNVTGVDGDSLPDLAPAIYTEDGASLLGSHVEFTVVDADYAQVAQYGVSFEEAAGKEVVQLSLGDGEMAGWHAGNDAGHEHGQIIIGTEENNIIYGSPGNDVLIGGGGHDTYVWDNTNMGHNEHALDIIKDFTKDDTLRFDDLLAEHHNAEVALENLLTGDSATWTLNAQGTGGTFLASDGDTCIQLSVAETVSTLTVTYQQDGEQFTQNVQLQNFGIGQIAPEGQLDQGIITHMLKEIIQVGGNT